MIHKLSKVLLAARALIIGSVVMRALPGDPYTAIGLFEVGVSMARALGITGDELRKHLDEVIVSVDKVQGALASVMPNVGAVSLDDALAEAKASAGKKS